MILYKLLYIGTIQGQTGTYIIKTFPASPAYMYQEAFCMYPIKRLWRAKVDSIWRDWNEI